MDFLKDLLDLVSGQLEDAVQSDVVVGQPIELGAVTIVPLSRLSVGLGVGGGEAQGEQFQTSKRNRSKAGKGNGQGGGSGMGARVRPVAVAVFTADGVDVLPIADKKGILDKITDKIPKLIDMVEKALERHDKGEPSAIESPAAS